MEVDSLVISLGLDADGFRAGINQAIDALRQIDQKIQFFSGQFAHGYTEGMQEAGAASHAAVQASEDAARAGQRMGQAYTNAGNTGARGINRLARETEHAKAKASEAGQAIEGLGRQWGSFLSGIVTRFAAPMAGALSMGAMVGTYLSGVEQVAQMYGRWTPQIEEWRKKQDLLSRVSREDIELYRKRKLAMLDFQSAMAGLSTTIMRAFSPAMEAGIKMLHNAADWIRRNEQNIIRFLTVLAGTITVVLLPALAKLGFAMLMNPVTWLIVGILALALVVDDLVTYINGGESALEDFWSIFGSGEEILQKLTGMWDTFKNIMEKFIPLIPSLAAGFSTFFILKSATDAIKAATIAFKAFNTALKANPVLFILSLVAAVVPLIIENWDKIKAAFVEVGDAIKKKWEEVVDWIEKKINWVQNKWKSTKKFFGFGDDEAQGNAETAMNIEPPQLVPLSSSLTSAAVPASAYSNRTNNITASTRIDNININTAATDAQGIARDISRELSYQPVFNDVYTSSVYASDGGVR